MACGLLLEPCALLSIVWPRPPCYLIIVSVTSPGSFSFVSLYILLVFAVLCFVVIYVLCEMVTSCVLSACLPVFPLRGGFCSFYFYFTNKYSPVSCIWVLASSLLAFPDKYTVAVFAYYMQRVLFRINIGLTLVIDVHRYVVNFIMVISVGFANLDLIRVLLLLKCN